MSLKRLDHFTPGKTIRLKGVAPDHGRFAVNIFNAHSPDDILFHFNPRFDENCIVRNSRLRGSWGNEERGGHMVFKPGKKFTLTIIRKPHVFRVLVDDEFFCKFEHRCGLPDSVLLEFDCGVEYF